MSQRVRLTAFVDPEIATEIGILAGRLSLSRMAEILIAEALEARNRVLASPAQESGRLRVEQKKAAQLPDVLERQSPIAEG